MGQPKREQERLDELRAAAQQAAIEAGYLRVCDVHEDIILIWGDDEDKSRAFQFAAALAKNREIDGDDMKKALQT